MRDHHGPVTQETQISGNSYWARTNLDPGRAIQIGTFQLSEQSFARPVYPAHNRPPRHVEHRSCLLIRQLLTIHELNHSATMIGQIA